MTNKINEHIGYHYSLFKTVVQIYSFGIEYIPQKVSSKIKYKSATSNIFRIQSDDSIICWFYCITFIEYMIAVTFLAYNNLFSPNESQKNDKIIYKPFKEKHGKIKCKSLD